MPKLVGLISSFCCYSKAKSHHWRSLPSTDEEDGGYFRERGHEVLAGLLHDCSSDSDRDEVFSFETSGEKETGWQDFVAKSNECREKNVDSCTKSQHTMSRLEKLKRAVERRRQDCNGSFSANMVTYSEPCVPMKSSSMCKISPRTDQIRRSNSTGKFCFSSSADDRSRSSVSTRSVGTMHVIDEELEYL